MSRLSELIAKANAKAGDTQKVQTSKTTQKSAPDYKIHKTKVESAANETNTFDDLEEYMSNIDDTAIVPGYGDDVTKGGNELEVGDPVVGMNRNQRMSGQVIAIDGPNATVEWRNRDVTQMPIDQLELTNVDDDYEEQTLYVESEVPNLGFDNEAFVNDSDLESLLKDRVGEGPTCNYDMNGDL